VTSVAEQPSRKRRRRTPRRINLKGAIQNAKTKCPLKYYKRGNKKMTIRIVYEATQGGADAALAKSLTKSYPYV
jgi:hypothetical protein